MIEFRTPQKIELEDGRFLFSAISHVGGRLVLTGIAYLDNPIDYEEVYIRLSREPETPVFERFVRAEYEPVVVLTAEIGEAPVTIHIEYAGRSWRIAPERENFPATRLSLMTLFRHDYRLLPEFVRHYSALGVERFHLYYNGKLSEIDWTYLRESGIAKDAAIVIYEWNIPYWWRLKAPSGVSLYDKQGFQHHAQTMAINHHLHCAKGSSRYCLFVDLDEYVFAPRADLDMAIESLVSYIQFQCWWMSPEPPEAYESFSLEDEGKNITVCTEGEGPGRTKCMVRVLDVDIMGVHWPHRHLGRRTFFGDGYFHIYRFPGLDRSRELKHPVATMTNAQFLAERFGRR